MARRELEWIAEKASELLADKVKEAPLTERDIELALEIFAIPRLKRLTGELGGERGYKQGVEYVREKLQGCAAELNAKHWGKATRA